jgi:hypothetical protein
LGLTRCRVCAHPGSVSRHSDIIYTSGRSPHMDGAGRRFHVPCFIGCPDEIEADAGITLSPQ